MGFDVREIFLNGHWNLEMIEDVVIARLRNFLSVGLGWVRWYKIVLCNQRLFSCRKDASVRVRCREHMALSFILQKRDGNLV